jgi:hypothetical protein
MLTPVGNILLTVSRKPIPRDFDTPVRTCFLCMPPPYLETHKMQFVPSWHAHIPLARAWGCTVETVSQGSIFWCTLPVRSSRAPVSAAPRNISPQSTYTSLHYCSHLEFRMKSVTLIVVLLIFTTLLTGCAPGPNDLEDTPQSEQENAAGFWLGMWHGIIAPITFVISLFNDNVGVYEVHNNGGWYNFGFLFGLGAVWGGGGGGAAASRRGR